MRKNLLGLMAGLLAACGGSGGAPQPGPPPAGNAPPGFTSTATASVAENSTGTVYTATAVDPDANPLTFSLAGGADQARFAISAGGALSFTAPPDFENPADADANNVYLVALQVSDGAASATLSLAVTITNVGPDGFRVTRVGSGFDRPVFLAPVPDNSGRVFVIQQAGLIRILNPTSGAVAATPFLDATALTTTSGERGLLGFVTAPDFAASGIFYVFLTDPAGNLTVRRYNTLAGNRDLADPASGDLILSVPHPVFTNHNGGWIGFGNDGFLYVATGDGGGAGDPNGNAQNRNSLLGKILRLDVAGDAFPADPARDYRIPAGNPFAAGGGAGEVWAFGLRNPFRNSIDPLTGALWIGDVGQNDREEIDIVRPGEGGLNFGWNVVEGTANFTGPPQPGFTPPVLEYLHGAGPRQGDSVTGGYVYRGPVESLRGQYIFADFIRPNIWSIPIGRIVIGATLGSDQLTIRTQAFAPNVGAFGNIVSLGVDQAGNLYFVDFDGEIFRLEAV